MRRCVQMAVLLVFGAIASGQAAAQVPRTDTAVCELPGGHRVELRSRYLWVPVNPHPRSKRSHYDQDDYSAELKLNRGARLELATWLSGTPMDEELALDYCARYGAGPGLVFSREELVLVPEGKLIDTLPLMRQGMPLPPEDRSPRQQELMAAQGFERASSAWAMRRAPDGSLVAEQALYGPPGDPRLQGVLRFESRDQGQSWSELGIFRQSETFTLGHTWAQQPFRGRPLRVNGKRVAR